MAEDPQHKDLVAEASYNLHRGWAHALPVYDTEELELGSHDKSLPHVEILKGNIL